MHVEARLPSVGSTTWEHRKHQFFFARSSVCLKKAIFLCEWPLLSSIQEDSVNILGKLRNFPGNRLVLHNLMGRIAQCVCISRSLYHTAVAKPWPQSFRTEFQRFSQVRYKIWTAQLIYSRYFMRAKEFTGSLRITVSLLISYASHFIPFVIKKSVDNRLFSEKVFA